jgi:hypothetical protein
MDRVFMVDLSSGNGPSAQSIDEVDDRDTIRALLAHRQPKARYPAVPLDPARRRLDDLVVSDIFDVRPM